MIRIKSKVIDFFVIEPPVSCHVFSFGDAKVSKKKDAMLMLSFYLFSKEKLYLRSIKWGSARHGASDRCSFGGPWKSWSVKYFPKKNLR